MLPASSHLDAEALRDHIPMILVAVSKDLRSAQTIPEKLAKSVGQQIRIHGAQETAAQTYALLRAKADFDIDQLVAEYRALRVSVLRLWFDSSTDATHLMMIPSPAVTDFDKNVHPQARVHLDANSRFSAGRCRTPVVIVAGQSFQDTISVTGGKGGALVTDLMYSGSRSPGRVCNHSIAVRRNKLMAPARHSGRSCPLRVQSATLARHHSAR